MSNMTEVLLRCLIAGPRSEVGTCCSVGKSSQAPTNRLGNSVTKTHYLNTDTPFLILFLSTCTFVNHIRLLYGMIRFWGNNRRVPAVNYFDHVAISEQIFLTHKYVVPCVYLIHIHQ